MKLYFMVGVLLVLIQLRSCLPRNQIGDETDSDEGDDDDDVVSERNNDFISDKDIDKRSHIKRRSHLKRKPKPEPLIIQKTSRRYQTENQRHQKNHKKTTTTTSKKHWQHFDGPIGGHYGDHLHGTMWGEHLNGGNFYPGDLWEYPYPTQGNSIQAPVHPVPVIYSLPHYPCSCGGKEAEDAKEVKVEKIGKEKKKKARKQLVPSHYYGPPSAGWGGFKPGQTGSGWGSPYWYKSAIPVAMPSKRFTNTEPHEEEHITHMGNWGGLNRAGFGYPLQGIGYGDAAGTPGGWDHGWGEGWGHVWPVGGSSTQHGSAQGDEHPDELVGGWGTRDLSDMEKLRTATTQDLVASEDGEQPVKKNT